MQCNANEAMIPQSRRDRHRIASPRHPGVIHGHHHPKPSFGMQYVDMSISLLHLKFLRQSTIREHSGDWIGLDWIALEGGTGNGHVM